jgi:hypothetical protein
LTAWNLPQEMAEGVAGVVREDEEKRKTDY